MSVDPQALRGVMRQWATGVTVVTSIDPDQGNVPVGMTASSFTSVSLEPPTVLVCINHNAHPHNIIARSGVFAVSLLAQGQEDLSMRFAGQMPHITDRFADLAVHVAETGAPMLGGAAGWLDCRVVNKLITGTHTIYIGEVIFAQGENEAQPLIYYNRNYQRMVPLEPKQG
jgi:flavin reductase (DIM6/NTAB) family NADH-FMN oxidoreductase RutF